jgi:hypothetical protein
MTNIEFGEWIHVEPLPKKTRKPRKAKIEKLLPVVQRPTRSNACSVEKHEMCTGVAYSLKVKSYVNCECDCGICAEFKSDFTIMEMVREDQAFNEYVDLNEITVEEHDAVRDAYYSAWAEARKYYNV